MSIVSQLRIPNLSLCGPDYYCFTSFFTSQVFRVLSRAPKITISHSFHQLYCMAEPNTMNRFPFNRHLDEQFVVITNNAAMNILAHSLCTTVCLGQILRNKIVCQKEYDEFQLIVPNGFTQK